MGPKSPSPPHDGNSLNLIVTEKSTYSKQSNNIARTHMPDETGFNPLEELDRSEARIVVKLEFRRFRKPVTIIQGLPNGRLAEIARELKQRFGAGGTTKGGELLLQGDHRKKAKDELVKLGFPGDHIDMI